jgi:hypothetical protein
VISAAEVTAAAVAIDISSRSISNKSNRSSSE